MTKLYLTLTSAFTALRARMHREEGATAVEYGLLVALIAAVIVLIVLALGEKIAAAFQAVVDALTGAGV
ncbi:MAG: Flp family type IVb pilin [Actinomycetota bacterium]